MKPKTFSELPLNTCSFATSDSVLGLDTPFAPTSSPTPTASNTWIYVCIAASCSCYCQIICSRSTSCQLMLYSDVGKIDNDNDDKERAELVLVSLF